ncbi:peptidase inhibitor family I36 protein [Streptomyces sp. NPDC005151]
MRKLVAGLAATAGAAALAFTGATPASAGTADCPREYFCAWYLSNFDGDRYKWDGNDSDWGTNHFANGHTVENDDRSWQNNGIVQPGFDRVKVYSVSGYTGDMTICLSPGSSVAAKSTAADRGSSHKWVGSC